MQATSCKTGPQRPATETALGAGKSLLPGGGGPAIATPNMQRNQKSGGTEPQTPARRLLGQSLDRSIVLVGLMGAGKSTVGRRLAKRIGLPFIDADAEIEAAAKLSVAEIFERFGEDYFRDGERRVIARLLLGPPVVMATGGGAFMNAETRALIAVGAISVWLDANIPVLAERVARRGTRPLVSGRDPVAVLSELADQRAPIYAQADIRIASDRAPHELAVTAIIEGLTRWTG